MRRTKECDFCRDSIINNGMNAGNSEACLEWYPENGLFAFTLYGKDYNGETAEEEYSLTILPDVWQKDWNGVIVMKLEGAIKIISGIEDQYPSRSKERMALKMAHIIMHKDVPRKPANHSFCVTCGGDVWFKEFMSYRERPDFCPHCGQALDWMEDDALMGMFDAGGHRKKDE